MITSSCLAVNQLPRFRCRQLALLLAIAAILTVRLVKKHNFDSSLPPWAHCHFPGFSHADPRALDLARTFEFSIKPIAYLFPQFHPIPENDEFWGVNFTEWTNVKKVRHNQFGLETLRPTEQIGYYNLLDRSTRRRQAQLVRDSGLYGIVFHHYWFGRPVMDKVLMSLLEDGEPNVPFMLSWANEPWTARWDGSDTSKILLRQVYGDFTDWRQHFNWMVPFFKHPNYIRVNGKVQFMVYNPLHMGDLRKRMFDTWRKWAIEEGLGGMDVIETMIEGSNPMDGGPADAINEFGFRSGGGHDGTQWPGITRLGRVYHRGASVSWDNTPRHATDGGGSANVFAHPRLWKIHMFEQMRRIKLDPNPAGEENFLFINALNEWGEGNVMEPSVQWGDGFSKALREAVIMAESLPWKTDVISHGTRLHKEIDNRFAQVDVCVIVKTHRVGWKWLDPIGLSDMLRSLKEQTNENWRAVVVRTNQTVEDRMVRNHILDAYDPRVQLAAVPEAVLAAETATSDGWHVTDWAIEHLAQLDEACSDAKYLLVANSSSTYTPTSFEQPALADPSSGSPDILGLNFESMRTIRENDHLVEESERCHRFFDDTAQFCVPASSLTPTAMMDVGAVLLKNKKIRESGFRFNGKGAALLGELFEANWSWVASRGESCHLLEAGAYSFCAATGRFWLDVPSTDRKYESGCYSSYTFADRYGWNMIQWDMDEWKRNPLCLRMRQQD